MIWNLGREGTDQAGVLQMAVRGRHALLLGLLLAVLGQTGTDAQKDVPEPRLSKFMGPTIKFLYCYS